MKDGLNKKDSSAYLGEGETDFAGTMEVLKKANNKGWFHLENFYGRKRCATHRRASSRSRSMIWRC